MHLWIFSCFSRFPDQFRLWLGKMTRTICWRSNVVLWAENSSTFLSCSHLQNVTVSGQSPFWGFNIQKFIGLEMSISNLHLPLEFNSLFSKVKIGKLKWSSSDSIKEGASLCPIRQNFRLKSAFFEWPIVNTFHNVKQNMSQFANEISKFQIYVKSPKLVCDSHAKDADWLKPHFFTSLTQNNCQCFISINPLWWISRQFPSYRPW